MDALAQTRARAEGLPWTSVNWDGWQAEDVPAPEGDVADGTRLGIISREGVRAFANLLPLAGLAPQLAVSTADLNARLEALGARRRPRVEEADAAEEARTGLRNDYVAPQGALEEGIAEVWAEALGVRRVGARDSFFELGGDSLLATQILPRLRERAQVELTLRNFFEAPTVAGLASLVEQMRSEQEAEHESEILKMLELLSEEELEAELNKRIQTTE
jgi:acyl carrier protein